jgi:hypothetical protein
MRLHDATANREPEPGTRPGAAPRAAIELLEDAFRIARIESLSTIGDVQP